jgi:hypothetical protein
MHFWALKIFKLYDHLIECQTNENFETWNFFNKFFKVMIIVVIKILISKLKSILDTFKLIKFKKF